MTTKHEKKESLFTVLMNPELRVSFKFIFNLGSSNDRSTGLEDTNVSIVASLANDNRLTATGLDLSKSKTRLFILEMM